MKLSFRYIKKHMGAFIVSIVFLTMEAMADLLQPTFMSYIVDDGIKNASVKRILVYGAEMLAIALVGAVSAIVRNHLSSKTSQTIGKELRSDMYKNVQSLSLENIDRLKPASIITRITNDVTQIQDFINSLMRMMVKAPITCIGAIVLIIIQTPKQAPIMGLIMVLVSIFIFSNIRFGYPKFGIVQKKLDKLNLVTREFLSSVRVVKAFRGEATETEKFSQSSYDLYRANTVAMQVMAIFSPLINLTVNFGIVLLLYIAGGKDSENIGRLMASVNYMTQVLFSVNMISMVINNAVRAVASSERIEEVLNEKPSQKMEENPVSLPIEGNVEFKNVSFSYADASMDALRDISFSVKPGKTVGIIGPTGSGKSTLINLLPRFYDVTKGEILIDGENVNRIDIKTLRESVSVVSQKALLFTGTIRDNLKWGKENATDSELLEALKISVADSFVKQAKEGLDTVLGQGGVNLSGGQKQRLSLARAIVRKPKILILDDCTSALDATTESRVLKGLSNMSEAMTVFLISQRISTVMKADFILCLDDGKIVGQGTHNDLLRSCTVYREIYKSQVGGIE